MWFAVTLSPSPDNDDSNRAKSDGKRVNIQGEISNVLTSESSGSSLDSLPSTPQKLAKISTSPAVSQNDIFKENPNCFVQYNPLYRDNKSRESAHTKRQSGDLSPRLSTINTSPHGSCRSGDQSGYTSFDETGYTSVEEGNASPVSISSASAWKENPVYHASQEELDVVVVDESLASDEKIFFIDSPRDSPDSINPQDLYSEAGPEHSEHGYLSEYENGLSQYDDPLSQYDNIELEHESVDNDLNESLPEQILENIDCTCFGSSNPLIDSGEWASLHSELTDTTVEAASMSSSVSQLRSNFMSDHPNDGGSAGSLIKVGHKSGSLQLWGRKSLTDSQNDSDNPPDSPRGDYSTKLPSDDVLITGRKIKDAQPTQEGTTIAGGKKEPSRSTGIRRYLEKKLPQLARSFSFPEKALGKTDQEKLISQDDQSIHRSLSDPYDKDDSESDSGTLKSTDSNSGHNLKISPLSKSLTTSLTGYNEGVKVSAGTKEDGTPDPDFMDAVKNSPHVLRKFKDGPKIYKPKEAFPGPGIEREAKQPSELDLRLNRFSRPDSPIYSRRFSYHGKSLASSKPEPDEVKVTSSQTHNIYGTPLMGRRNGSSLKRNETFSDERSFNQRRERFDPFREIKLRYNELSKSRESLSSSRSSLSKQESPPEHKSQSKLFLGKRPRESDKHLDGIPDTTKNSNQPLIPNPQSPLSSSGKATSNPGTNPKMDKGQQLPNPVGGNPSTAEVSQSNPGKVKADWSKYQDCEDTKPAARIPAYQSRMLMEAESKPLKPISPAAALHKSLNLDEKDKAIAAPGDTSKEDSKSFVSSTAIEIPQSAEPATTAPKSRTTAHISVSSNEDTKTLISTAVADHNPTSFTANAHPELRAGGPEDVISPGTSNTYVADWYQSHASSESQPPKHISTFSQPLSSPDKAKLASSNLARTNPQPVPQNRYMSDWKRKPFRENRFNVPARKSTEVQMSSLEYKSDSSTKTDEEEASQPQAKEADQNKLGKETSSSDGVITSSAEKKHFARTEATVPLSGGRPTDILPSESKQSLHKTPKHKDGFSSKLLAPEKSKINQSMPEQKKIDDRGQAKPQVKGIMKDKTRDSQVGSAKTADPIMQPFQMKVEAKKHERDQPPVKSKDSFRSECFFSPEPSMAPLPMDIKDIKERLLELGDPRQSKGEERLLHTKDEGKAASVLPQAPKERLLETANTKIVSHSKAEVTKDKEASSKDRKDSASSNQDSKPTSKQEKFFVKKPAFLAKQDENKETYHVEKVTPWYERLRNKAARKTSSATSKKEETSKDQGKQIDSSVTQVSDVSIPKDLSSESSKPSKSQPGKATLPEQSSVKLVSESKKSAEGKKLVPERKTTQGQPTATESLARAMPSLTRALKAIGGPSVSQSTKESPLDSREGAAVVKDHKPNGSLSDLTGVSKADPKPAEKMIKEGNVMRQAKLAEARQKSRSGDTDLRKTYSSYLEGLGSARGGLTRKTSEGQLSSLTKDAEKRKEEKALRRHSVTFTIDEHDAAIRDAAKKTLDTSAAQKRFSLGSNSDGSRESLNEASTKAGSRKPSIKSITESDDEKMPAKDGATWIPDREISAAESNQRNISDSSASNHSESQRYSSSYYVELAKLECSDMSSDDNLDKPDREELERPEEPMIFASKNYDDEFDEIYKNNLSATKTVSGSMDNISLASTTVEAATESLTPSVQRRKFHNKHSRDKARSMYEGSLHKSASFGYLSNLDKTESTDTEDEVFEGTDKKHPSKISQVDSSTSKKSKAISTTTAETLEQPNEKQDVSKAKQKERAEVRLEYHPPSPQADRKPTRFTTASTTVPATEQKVKSRIEQQTAVEEKAAVKTKEVTRPLRYVDPSMWLDMTSGATKGGDAGNGKSMSVSEAFRKTDIPPEMDTLQPETGPSTKISPIMPSNDWEKLKMIKQMLKERRQKSPMEGHPQQQSSLKVPHSPISKLSPDIGYIGDHEKIRLLRQMLLTKPEVSTGETSGSEASDGEMLKTETKKSVSKKAEEEQEKFQIVKKIILSAGDKSPVTEPVRQERKRVEQNITLSVLSPDPVPVDDHTQLKLMKDLLMNEESTKPQFLTVDSAATASKTTQEKSYSGTSEYEKLQMIKRMLQDRKRSPAVEVAPQQNNLAVDAPSYSKLSPDTKVMNEQEKIQMMRQMAKEKAKQKFGHMQKKFSNEAEAQLSDRVQQEIKDRHEGLKKDLEIRKKTLPEEEEIHLETVELKAKSDEEMRVRQEQLDKELDMRRKKIQDEFAEIYFQGKKEALQSPLQSIVSPSSKFAMVKPKSNTQEFGQVYKPKPEPVYPDSSKQMDYIDNKPTQMDHAQFDRHLRQMKIPEIREPGFDVKNTGHLPNHQPTRKVPPGFENIYPSPNTFGAGHPMADPRAPMHYDMPCLGSDPSQFSPLGLKSPHPTDSVDLDRVIIETSSLVVECDPNGLPTSNALACMRQNIFAMPRHLPNIYNQKTICRLHEVFFFDWRIQMWDKYTYCSRHKFRSIEKLVARVEPSLPHLATQDGRPSHGKTQVNEASHALPQLSNKGDGLTRQQTVISPRDHKGEKTIGPSDRDYSQSLPLTPAESLKLYGSRLTAYEQSEILDYPEIWYLGLDAKKIDGIHGGPQNAGYDDENGSYIKVLSDQMVYRYEMQEVLGKGSFGQVVKAQDHKTGQQVAIKIIRNKKRFHHQALVEVKILDALRRKDRENQYNVVHMLEYFYFRNHLCIVFELMGMNLYELIKKNNFQGFSIALIRRFAYSMLQCLKILNKEKIIHCDLKPENILLRQRGQTSIKVIDFGSSCYEHQRVYTYIQSRFYRSPEVILGLPYSMPIDMWSFGCILAELYTGYPLFPGENEVEQLACIMEILGLPPVILLDQATRRRLFFDSKGQPRCITNSKGKKRKPHSKDLSQAIKTNDTNFLDFIRRCLEWDPGRRMSPDDACQHPWIREALVHRSKNVSRQTSKRHTQTSYAVADVADYKAGGIVPEKGIADDQWAKREKRLTDKVRERLQQAPPGDTATQQTEVSSIKSNGTAKESQPRSKEEEPPDQASSETDKNFLPPIENK